MSIGSSNDTTTGAEPPPPLVIVVDDEIAVRSSLDSLFRSMGFRTSLFASAAELLAATVPGGPGCIVLDVRLPGINGLELQTQLSRQGIELPIIFMTGHGDIPMSVRAMKAGAVDFLPKPFREQDMLDAVLHAVERDRVRRAQVAELDGIRSRYATLTPREREIMELVTRGLLNKQVAAQIGLSEITVKIHRGNLMRKMGVRTFADLVRQAESLGVRTRSSTT